MVRVSDDYSDEYSDSSHSDDVEDDAAVRDPITMTRVINAKAGSASTAFWVLALTV